VNNKIKHVADIFLRAEKKHGDEHILLTTYPFPPSNKHVVSKGYKYGMN